MVSWPALAPAISASASSGSASTYGDSGAVRPSVSAIANIGASPAGGGNAES